MRPRRAALGAIVGVAAATAACKPAGPSAAAVPAPAPPATTPPAKVPTIAARAIPNSLPPALLAEKLTFGPTPALLAEIARLGPRTWVEQQLDPRNLPDASNRLRGFPALTNTNVRNFELEQRASKEPAARQVDHATLVRAVHSQRQLHEMMCDVWLNHFNVWRNKGPYFFLFVHHHERVIRSHALGRFEDLLIAVSRSPAMLNYLDNRVSNAFKPGGANQNFARELLELHTLGIMDGRAIHTQTDVLRAARLFSGWSVTTDEGPNRFQFTFRSEWHDRAGLRLIGDSWSRPARSPGQGESDGVHFLRFLANHPRTARFIAWKLCVRFVGERPPAALVDEAAAVYRANGTRIAPVLRHIISSPEFAGAAHSRVRRPLEFLAGVLRSSGANFPDHWDTVGARRLRLELAKMGQPLNERPSPDGYPDADGFWVSADTLLRRWHIVARLARNTLNPDHAPAAERITVATDALLPSPLPPTTGELLNAVMFRLSGRPMPSADLEELCRRIGLTTTSPSSAVFKVSRGGFPSVLALLLTHPRFQRR